jgi:hypothetical protein
LRVSRRGDYAKAPKAALDHVRAMTIDVLCAARSGK